MAVEISPVDAADLALEVYSVNSGVARDLKRFLKNKMFAQAGGNKLIEAEVGGRILRSAKDGFGLCAQGGEGHEGDLFLIFRGTTTAHNNADVVTDARIGLTFSKTGLPVHIGFNHTFNSMLPDIQDFIAQSGATGTVHCVGHSLGGAVASLAADWVKANTIHPVKLYTFGAPRVGTRTFVARTSSRIGEANMHRVYHRTDPVPMIALYPFMHAPHRSQGHFIPSEQPLTTGDAHRMPTYLEDVTKNNSWDLLSESQDEPYSIGVCLENWLKSKSPVDSSSATFWRWINSALIYLVSKISMGVAYAFQGAFIGLHTIADKLAYLLAKGIDLAENISSWVVHFMRKVMEALHMKVVKNKNELTRSLIRSVLLTMMEKANKEARNALKHII